MASSPVVAALRRVTAALPGQEERPSQIAMVEAVAHAVSSQRHLVVQAGTGTGKSLGYLVPALAAGARVVVATATKALQDQLATRDLPVLADHLGVPFEFAVLKGRSNYVCVQRVRELAGAEDRPPLLDPGLPVVAAGPLGRELRRLEAWAEDAATGDRADLPWEPSTAAWAQVSVTSRECPGAPRCPSGEVCFAEAARARAAEADVVVVNTHLYAAHLASGGEVLPPHDIVVFDEAHELEDIASASFGVELSPGRFTALARSARPLLPDAAVGEAVESSGAALAAALEPHLGRRLPRDLPADLTDALGAARTRVAALDAGLRHGPGDDAA
ncbi:MAG: ATP-dependent DNA helicase, partial [Acidimicrobiales bacterium]